MKIDKIKRIVILALILVVIVGIVYEMQQCATNNRLRKMYDLLRSYRWQWSVDCEHWYTLKKGSTVFSLDEATLYDIYCRDISVFIEVIGEGF